MADPRVEEEAALREIARAKHVLAVAAEDADEGVDRDAGECPIRATSLTGHAPTISRIC